MRRLEIRDPWAKPSTVISAKTQNADKKLAKIISTPSAIETLATGRQVYQTEWIRGSDPNATPTMNEYATSPRPRLAAPRPPRARVRSSLREKTTRDNLDPVRLAQRRVASHIITCAVPAKTSATDFIHYNERNV
jgi:hypothetical protein